MLLTMYLSRCVYELTSSDNAFASGDNFTLCGVGGDHNVVCLSTL